MGPTPPESREPDDASMLVSRLECVDDRAVADHDAVVVEEPLEIRVGGVPVAVVMRTPGHDDDLVRGFLVTERIIAHAGDVASVRHCDTIDDPRAENNVMQVVLTPDVEVDLGRLRRNLYASSSCGICGKATLDAVLQWAEPLEHGPEIDIEHLYRLPETLRRAQAVFERTGGLHAAGLFAADGSLLVLREDIGRHNAVDKTIGWASVHATAESPPAILMVSGRVSFEIVQKAVAARVPAIAAVSAPSSLAIELARRCGVTLAAFVRGRRLCIYAGEDRVTGLASEPDPER